MYRAGSRIEPSRLLNLCLWGSAGVGLLGVALGVWAMAADARQQGEEWDGLGLFIGTLLVLGGSLWASPHLILSLWLVRRRHRGQSLWRVGAMSAAVASFLLTLLSMYLATGAAQLTTLLVPVCACLLVLGTGVLVAADSKELANRS